jgi:putative membrane protein
MNLKGILHRSAAKEVKKELKVQEKQNVEIRDQLAMERTKLANERTFLAYSRTGMALVIAGLSFIKFFEDPLYKVLGALFIPMGLIVGFIGYRKYARKQEKIDTHTSAYTPTSAAHAEVAAQEKQDPAQKSEPA